MSSSKKILVAPLNWGLGHATRCIPLIKALQSSGYEVVLASDGNALALLEKEFPELTVASLPSYNIQYSKKASGFKLKLIAQLPQIQKVISEEKKVTKSLIKEHDLDGIISDNRLGVRHKDIPSVILTHQINVLSGNTSFFSSKVHQRFIKKFDECWVPDYENSPNFSGKLGHPKEVSFPVKYIGTLSRMNPQKLSIKYEIIIIISGPEPQRGLFEKMMIEAFQNSKQTVLLVKGVVESNISKQTINKLQIVNFLPTSLLEEAINQSDIVICRSGYTSIMDLAALTKKVFFIPTPGQFEQLYLAKRLKAQGIAPSCRQREFSVNKLYDIPLYSGLKASHPPVNLSELFGLFEGKGEFASDT